jgi:hypothetical protein
MKTLGRCLVLILLVELMTAACERRSRSLRGRSSERESLVGAWRSDVLFKSGSFTEMKGLQFLYVFNAGGTLTESSNYDAAPPVPPAYGLWRKIGRRQFEARYEFYVTKAPGAFDDIAKGGGWLPAGRGVFSEAITLSEDGKSYSSKINYAAFDRGGKPSEGGGEADGQGVRLGF